MIARNAICIEEREREREREREGFKMVSDGDKLPSNKVFIIRSIS